MRKPNGTNFENLPVDELAEILRRFYGTVLSKNRKEYSKSGMVNIRSGLNHYLQDPPNRRNIDLMHDKQFLQANKVFTGRLRDNKEKGLDVSKPQNTIEQEDMEKLFKEYFARGIKNSDTQILLHKVFFDIIYYTRRRGKKVYVNLTKTHSK